MNEKKTGMIDPNKLMINRKNRLRKPLRPKSRARLDYERMHPAISIRVDEHIKFEFLHSAKSLGLTEKEFLEKLITNAHLEIDKAQAAAFQAGRDYEAPLAYEKGRTAGTAQMEETQFRKLWKDAEETYALKVHCVRCQDLIPVTQEMVIDLEKLGWYCSRCSLHRRMAHYYNPETSAPQFWPVGYSWPARPSPNPP